MYVENGILKFPEEYNISLRNGLLTSVHDEFFTSDDLRRINSWLTSPQFPKLFKFNNTDYFKEDVEFFVTITAVKADHSENPYQLTYTLTCDSPYGYTPLKTEKLFANGHYSTDILIYNHSDCLDDYVYPTIKIIPTKAGSITLTNLSDVSGQELKLTIDEKHLNPFYLDSDKLMLYRADNEDITFEDIGITESNIENMYWMRLRSGFNKIQCKGEAIVHIIWREPRKVGVF